MADTEEIDPPSSRYFIIPQRIIMAIMGFFAMVNSYAMRYCILTTMTHLVVVVNKTQENMKPGDILCEHDLMDMSEVTGGEYEWSQELQGFILSSFYIGYLITHIPGGILADKFGGKWILVIGIFLTAVLTVLTPTVIYLSGAWGLITIRIFMGLTEGTVFPALNRLLAEWVPLRERGLLGALVLGGGQIGSLLGYIMPSFILQNYKWPFVFYFFGILAVIWVIAFVGDNLFAILMMPIVFFETNTSFKVVLCTSDPISHPFIKVKEKQYLMREIGMINRVHNLKSIPWVMIFTSVPTQALISAQLGHDWGLYIMSNDLPKYMNDIMQFSFQTNGVYSSLPNIAMWICTIVSGAIADVLISKQCMSITNVRKMMTAIAAFGPAIFMILASYSNCNRIAVVINFSICMGLMGAYFAGSKLSPLDMGPNYAGTLMGIVNGMGSVTGILGPSAVGVMTANTTILEWRMVFWVACYILCLTTVVFCIWGSGEIQPFNDPPPKNKEEEKSPA